MRGGTRRPLPRNRGGPHSLTPQNPAMKSRRRSTPTAARDFVLSQPRQARRRRRAQWKGPRCSNRNDTRRGSTSSSRPGRCSAASGNGGSAGLVVMSPATRSAGTHGSPRGHTHRCTHGYTRHERPSIRGFRSSGPLSGHHWKSRQPSCLPSLAAPEERRRVRLGGGAAREITGPVSASGGPARAAWPPLLRRPVEGGRGWLSARQVALSTRTDSICSRLREARDASG